MTLAHRTRRRPHALQKKRPDAYAYRVHEERAASPGSLIFHESMLISGVKRSILGFETGGAPTIAIAATRGGHPAGRFLIFERDALIARKAIAESRSGRPGRVDAGEIVTRCGLSFIVWSRVENDGSGRVLLGRVDTKTREHVGGVCTLSDDEVNALEQALEWQAATVRK